MMKKILATIGLVMFVGYFLMLVLYFGGRILGKDMSRYENTYSAWTWYALGYLMGVGLISEFG